MSYVYVPPATSQTEQAEGGQGQPEDQGAVQARALPPCAGEKHGDHAVHDKEKDKKGLDGGKMGRRVIGSAPERADAEGAGDAETVAADHYPGMDQGPRPDTRARA